MSVCVGACIYISVYACYKSVRLLGPLVSLATGWTTGNRAVTALSLLLPDLATPVQERF